MAVDWAKIKEDYINGGIGQLDLAEKYGVTLKQVSYRAVKEGWVEERKRNRGSPRRKATNKETGMATVQEKPKKLRNAQQFKEDLEKNPPNAFPPEYIENLFVTARKCGRKKKFSSAEELEKLCIEYFQDKVVPVWNEEMKQTRYKWGERPTMSGLALHLGMGRRTLINYAKDGEFAATARVAKDLCESYLESALFDNRNPAGLCFALKNGYGWRDSYEITAVERPDPLGEQMSQEELEARLADLPIEADFEVEDI